MGLSTNITNIHGVATCVPAVLFAQARHITSFASWAKTMDPKDKLRPHKSDGGRWAAPAGKKIFRIFNETLKHSENYDLRREFYGFKSTEEQDAILIRYAAAYKPVAQFWEEWQKNSKAEKNDRSQSRSPRSAVNCVSRGEVEPQADSNRGEQNLVSR
jgi:hypothetical protein